MTVLDRSMRHESEALTPLASLCVLSTAHRFLNSFLLFFRARARGTALKPNVDAGLRGSYLRFNCAFFRVNCAFFRDYVPFSECYPQIFRSKKLTSFIKCAVNLSRHKCSEDGTIDKKNRF
jgi:hypothetical protein